MVLDHSSWEVRIIPFCSLVLSPYKYWEIAFNQFFKGFLSQLVQGHGLERCVEGAHYCSRQLITSGPHLDSECPFQWISMNQWNFKNQWKWNSMNAISFEVKRNLGSAFSSQSHKNNHVITQYFRPLLYFRSISGRFVCTTLSAVVHYNSAALFL